MQNSKKLMINLACGFTGHDDWINVDWGILSLINKFPILKKIIFGLKLAPQEYNNKWPKNLKLVNLRKSFPFASNSVDYIFTAHFIEHLKKYEAVKLLKECHRSLKSGGTIRIVVPDLDIAVKQYLDNPDSLRKVEILNNHFWGVLEQGDVFPSLHENILGLFARGHNWLYNYDYLKKILVLSGFKVSNIKKCAYRQGETPNIDYLDNHPDHSLYVEATK